MKDLEARIKALERLRSARMRVPLPPVLELQYVDSDDDGRPTPGQESGEVVIINPMEARFDALLAGLRKPL